MPSMLAHIKVLGLEPEQDGMRGNPPRSRATLRPIAFQAEHKEEQGNDHSHTPPMISDGHRYCVGLTRIITVERSCSNKVVLSSTILGGDQVMPLLVRPNTYLPLTDSNRPHDNVIDILLKAVRKAKDEPLVYDKREQAFVFEARCTQDGSARSSRTGMRTPNTVLLMLK